MHTECGYWGKMKTCQVAMADLTGLPSHHRQTISEDYMDRMGHMNGCYYMAVFDTDTWRMFADYGLDDAYFSTTENGVFALKQFIQYLAEVRPGETVAVYTRLPGFTDIGTSTAFNASADQQVHAEPNVLGGIDPQVSAVESVEQHLLQFEKILSFIHFRYNLFPDIPGRRQRL